MHQAAESMREVARQVIESLKWLNAALDKELRMEARVTIPGIAVILLADLHGKMLSKGCKLQELVGALAERLQLKEDATVQLF